MPDVTEKNDTGVFTRLCAVVLDCGEAQVTQDFMSGNGGDKKYSIQHFTHTQRGAATTCALRASWNPHTITSPK